MWFWRKQNAEAAPPRTDAPAPNRIDELAHRLQREGRTDQLERELEQFAPTDLESSERESWYHLYGIAASRRGDYERAFQRFAAGLDQCPDSGPLLFSLGQEHERRGEIDSMFACFDRAPFPSVSGGHALTEARYAYLWNRTDRGWDYLAPLIPAYEQLRVLDDTFLWMRGLPFFGTVWDHLAAIAQLDQNFDRLRRLTRGLSKQCRDFDFRELRMRIDALDSGDRSALKKRLAASITKYRRHGFQMGSETLQLHVILAQEARHEGESVALLEAVTFGSNDFAWLADMRVLALAERMHAFGNAQREQELRAEFFRRQPLLFEPGHALTFGLLMYQETLKPVYQQTRQKR